MNDTLCALGAAGLGRWWKRVVGWKEVSWITAVMSLKAKVKTSGDLDCAGIPWLGILHVFAANKPRFGGVFLALLW